MHREIEEVTWRSPQLVDQLLNRIRESRVS